jgi:hypothetical protein
MGKNMVKNKLENAMEKVMEGNKNFSFYLVSENEAIRTVLGKNVKPHTLIIFLQIGEEVFIRAFYNGKNIDFQKDNPSEKHKIACIFDSKNKKNPEIIIRSDEDIEIYSKEFKDDKHHRVIIYQENRHFTEIINYDSKANMPPARIVFNNDDECKLLKNLALSILGKNDDRFYRIFSESEL